MSRNYQGHLVTSSVITIVTDTDTLTVPVSHLAFDKVKQALKEGDYVEAIKLADAAVVVNTFGEGHVYVKDGVVHWNGTPLHNSLTKRISAMIRDGFDVNPMVKFLENLMENPSSRAIKELYRFLECNNLPITPDGFFLAYKNVNVNYRDKHSNKFDNSIGATCEMARNQVMDDPNQTCSTGLHFCSINYLNDMWGHDGHTMIIKINPADVVSIPVDYDNSKGRCCKYVVLGEHKDGTEDTLSNKSVHNIKTPYEEGYDAYLNDEGDVNPYSCFSEHDEHNHSEWEEGYEDATSDNSCN